MGKPPALPQPSLLEEACWLPVLRCVACFSPKSFFCLFLSPPSWICKALAHLSLQNESVFLILIFPWMPHTEAILALLPYSGVFGGFLNRVMLAMKP